MSLWDKKKETITLLKLYRPLDQPYLVIFSSKRPETIQAHDNLNNTTGWYAGRCNFSLDIIYNNTWQGKVNILPSWYILYILSDQHIFNVFNLHHRNHVNFFRKSKWNSRSENISLCKRVMVKIKHYCSKNEINVDHQNLTL